VRKLIEITTSVSVIAVIHAIFVFIQFEYLNIFNNTPQMAVFFIPAAVRVFSVIIFGYWAGLGVLLGTLIHDLYLHPTLLTNNEILFAICQQGVAVSLSLLVWALISRKITGLNNPTINFSQIDAFDILQMCVIQALLNIFYISSPSINMNFDWYNYAVMLVGDLTGAFFIFIIANVMFSLLKRTRFFPHKHYDDTMNNQ
jgi:hypothetical protein